MSSQHSKLNSLTIREKIDFIDLIESGRSIANVAKEMRINRNTLHYIYKNKNKIKAEIFKTPVIKYILFYSQ